jgi:hypothetical protein
MIKIKNKLKKERNTHVRPGDFENFSGKSLMTTELAGLGSPQFILNLRWKSTK